MGNTCKPMAVSFQCMTKFTKKRIKQLLITSALKTKKKNKNRTSAQRRMKRKEEEF